MKRSLTTAVVSIVVAMSACASSTTRALQTTPSSPSPTSTSAAPSRPNTAAATEPTTQAAPIAATSSTIATTEPASASPVPTTDSPTDTTPSTGIEEAVSADYQTDQTLYWAVVFSPSTNDLEARVAEFSVPGEQIFEAVVRGVQDLVRVGDVYAPNTPDIRRDSIEDVHIEGANSATVTVCAVDNSLRITPASKSPTGSVIVEDNTGQIVATRLLVTMKLSAGRWRQATYPGDALGIWKGQDHCEPA